MCIMEAFIATNDDNTFNSSVKISWHNKPT